MCGLVAHGMTSASGTLPFLLLRLCGPCSNSYVVPTSGLVGRGWCVASWPGLGQVTWAEHQGQRSALAPAGLACWCQGTLEVGGLAEVCLVHSTSSVIHSYIFFY